MKRLLIFLIVLLNISTVSPAQDIIYNISAEIGDRKTSLDSVRIENLTNNSEFSLKDIPVQDEYLVNLSKQTLVDFASIKKIQRNGDWLLLHNYPGVLSVSNTNSSKKWISISVYTITGVPIFQERISNSQLIAGLRFHLSGFGIYLVKLDSEFGTSTFKALGSDKIHMTEVIPSLQNTSNYSKSVQLQNSGKIEKDDSIKISVFKKDFHAEPANIKVYGDTSIIFKLLADVRFGILTDVENNNYKTVKIGNQEWMAENLATTKFSDGTPIRNIIDNNKWTTLADTGMAYCWYNNDLASKEGYGYGALYSYGAAVRGIPQTGINIVQGVCPNGWHIPSDTEWTELAYYLADRGYNYDKSTGGGNDKIGKSLATTNDWYKNDLEGSVGNDRKTNNSSGFSAIPSGRRYGHNGMFFEAWDNSFWWSSTESSGSSAWGRSISVGSPKLIRYHDLKPTGTSVRCVKNISPDYDTIVDIDGNIYKTIFIGDQEWMADNLATTRYADGTPIPNIAENSIWSWLADNNSNKAYCWYNDEIANKSKHGALYTYAAAVNGTPVSSSVTYVQGACPSGWHLPSNNEWQILTNYLSYHGYNYNGTTGGNFAYIGKSMASTTDWSMSGLTGNVGYDLNSNNRSGFNGTPSGYRGNENGVFFYSDHKGLWWSSTPVGTTKAQTYGLTFDAPGAIRDSIKKSSGVSVRCLKDNDIYIEDIDGNKYTTVKIGSQEWLMQNLATTRYSDGSPIPKITDYREWALLEDNNTSKAFCWYNNDTIPKTTFGALYTYAAVVNGTPHIGTSHIQGACPLGWHVPSQFEWRVMINQLINNGYNYFETSIYTNTIAKSLSSQDDWRTSHIDGTIGSNPKDNNSTGFSATPAGFRFREGGAQKRHEFASWWTSSSHELEYATQYTLEYDLSRIQEYSKMKSRGNSVRCLKDYEMGKVMDIDGNVYQTIHLGNQEWMTENMKATTYAGGQAIPNVVLNADWISLENNNTDKAFCWPDNTLLNKEKYGALYTYAAVVNDLFDKGKVPVQGVCPDEWHVPNYDEWMELANYLANNGYNYDGSYGGGSTKIAKSLASSMGWNTSMESGDIGNDRIGNNLSGFTALPVKQRQGNNAEFMQFGNNTAWWCSYKSGFVDENNAPAMMLFFQGKELYTTDYVKKSGLSVRCLRSTVSDIDGNKYPVLQIGDQEWMGEDLRTSRYADGTVIHEVTSPEDWAALRDNNTAKAFCRYEVNVLDNKKYDTFYSYAAAVNGATLSTNVQGACPEGWHLPSVEEWAELENYLADNGHNYDGSIGGGNRKLAKSLASKSAWYTTGDVGTIGHQYYTNNSSSFSALPAGHLSHENGELTYKGTSCNWWCSTELNDSIAWYRGLDTLSPIFIKNLNYKSSGYSIRCLKNDP